MSTSKRATQSRPISRAGTATPIPMITVTTPIAAAVAAAEASSNGSTSSPNYQTRTNRLQEKEELQHLNDRLACYIERMRNLKNDNERLTQEIQSAQETTQREVTNIKAMYERELSAARKLIDEVSREKAKLEIDINRLWEENDNLTEKLDKKSKDLAIAENSARINESRFNEINNKYKTILNDRKKAQDDANEYEMENERLRKQLDDMRKQLENETLARVDLENVNQSLREEMSFKEQIHVQEITEARTSRQVEISEIDGRLSKQYEMKLQQSLQELRHQYESQMRTNREEIELLYDGEIKNLQAAVNRAANASVSTIEELRMNRMKIDGLNGRIEELEKEIITHKAHIRDLENILDNERARNNQHMAALEAELNRMRGEMANQLQEYQDLMDIKVSLDLEIAAYDKLLCGEERRLNIKSPPTRCSTGETTTTAITATASSSRPAKRTTPARRPSTPMTSNSNNNNHSSSITSSTPTKRRRTIVVDESEEQNLIESSVKSIGKGDIKIMEADTDGRFIKLFNNGNDEYNLTGWQLIRTIASGGGGGDGENNDSEFVFKFTRSTKINAGSTLTIWSNDAGISHDPPINIVMKKKWPIGDNMKSSLMNSEKEEIAVYENAKSNTSTHSLRHKTSTTGTTTALTLAATSASVKNLFSLLF